MEENGTNSIFPIFSGRKSDKIVISEILFSKNLILNKNYTVYTISKTQDIGLLVNNYTQNLDQLAPY